MSKLVFSVDRNDENADFLIRRDSDCYHFNNYSYYSDYEVLARIKKQDMCSYANSYKLIGKLALITDGMKERDKEPLLTILEECEGSHTVFTELPDGCYSRMKGTDLATNLFLLLDCEQRIDFLKSMRVVFSTNFALKSISDCFRVEHALFRTDGDKDRLNKLKNECELSKRIMECPINFRDILQYPFDIKDLYEKYIELYKAD